MSDNPVWRREGWAPSGPGYCHCPECGARVSTNALARARHRCKPKPASSVEPLPTITNPALVEVETGRRS